MNWFKKVIEKIKALKKGTIIRTIIQFLSYVNQIIAIVGFQTFADNVIYQWITVILTIVITALSYWYNNDWSKAALTVKDIFDMLKDGKITYEEVQNFIKKYTPEKLEETKKEETVEKKEEDK